MGKAPPGRQSKQPRGAPPADLDFPIEEIERLQAMPAPVEQNSWKPWAIGAVLVFVAHLTIALVMLQDADPGYFYNVRYANIGNIDFAKDAPYMGYPAIDVVYTWVNGSDPRWKREKDYWHRRWKAQINGEIFDETDESIVFDASAAATENRFRDNEELRYSLRSIEMYAPWVRHVYLVTDGQIPSWLNVDSPRLTIVPHRDIFANRSHLPVFSSPAIESNLDNIPGLSSLFLYFNDDVFLGAPVTPEDFISPSGIQNIYLSWEVPECSSGCQETFLGNGVCDPLCNTTACAFDMGDCGCREVPTADPLEYDVVCDPQPAPAEPVAEPPKAAEPEANPLNCVEACPWLWIGDGSCDVNCNVSACGYDAGDCTTNALTLLPSVVVDATNDTSIGIQVPLNVDALVVRIPDRFDFFDHATFVNEELIRRAVLLEENMTLVLVFARPETTGVPTGGSSMKIEGEVNETTTQFTLHVLRGERAITQGVYTLPGSNLQDLQLLRLVDPASPELVMLSLQVPYHAVDDWAKSVVATNSWTPSQPSLCPPIAPEPSTTTPEGEGQKYYFCILDGRNLNMRWKWNSTALIGTENESPFSQGDICVFNAEQKQCINVILFVDSSNIKWLSPALPTIEKTPTWTGVWDDKEDCVWLDWYLNSFGVLAGNCSFESSKEEEAQPLAPAQPDPEVVKKAKAMCSSIAKRLKLRSEEDAPSVWTQIRDAVLSVKTLFYLNTLTTLEEPRHHMLSTDDVAACEAYFTENAIELPSPPKDDHAVRSTDTFGDSLRFVNKLYNAKFGKVDGFYRRRVPSHMPHFIQKKYLTEMKSHWAAEFNATSSHRFRHPKDMQFSFSYMYYVVNRHKMHPPTLEEVFDTYIDINRDGMIDEHEALSVASLLAKGEHPSEADIEAVKACITPNTTASSREEVRREGKVTITETTQPYLTLESLRECKNVTDKLIQTAIDRLPPTHAMMSEKQVTFHMLSDQYRTAWNQLLNTRAKRTKFICINDDMKYPSVTVGNILNDLFTSLWPHRSQFELPYHLQNRYGHVDELAAAKRMQWIIFGIVLVIVAIIVVAVWWPESSPTNDEKKPSQTATSSSSVEAEQDRLTSFWSVVALEKSNAQIEAQRWIFVVPFAPGKYCLPLCTLPFQRWMLFVAPFVAQFCNGSLYAWSILNPHIDSYIQGRSMDAMPPPPNRTESGPPAQMNNSVPPDEKAVVAFYSAASFLGFAARLLVDQVVVLALLKSPIHDPNSFGLFQVVVFFLTFSYGGVIGIMPSLLTDMFGVYNSGTMHGIILTGWSICAIGGGLTFQHYFFKIKDSYPMEQMRDGEIAAYISNFHWLMVVACIGLALVPLVRTNPVDRFYPGYQYSIFGRPLIRFTKKDY